MSKLTKLKEDPELLNTLEAELKAISGAVRRLLAGPLNRRAVMVLLKDTVGTSIGHREIEAVVSAIEGLDTRYLKKRIGAGK